MIALADDELYHEGKPRRSGRYPWGSGLRPFQSLKETVSRKKSPTTKSDHDASKTSEAPREKQVKDLTDDELKSKIVRLRLEQDYNKLLSEMNPKKTSMAQTFIEKQKKTIPGILDKAIDDIGTQGMKVLLGEAINSMAGKKIVNPYHGQKDKS